MCLLNNANYEIKALQFQMLDACTSFWKMNPRFSSSEWNMCPSSSRCWWWIMLCRCLANAILKHAWAVFRVFSSVRALQCCSALLLGMKLVLLKNGSEVQFKWASIREGVSFSSDSVYKRSISNALPPLRSTVFVTVCASGKTLNSAARRCR